MAKAKKTTKPAMQAVPQPRLDSANWELCLGDRVTSVPGTPASTLFSTGVAALDHFDSDYTFCHVARENQPGLVRVACAELRWEMPSALRRPTAPKQRVRVVVANMGQASEELKALDGKLGWVVSLDYIKEDMSMITVRFEDAALEQWPTAINSTDLLVVSTPVVHYQPADVTEVRLSPRAWDLLETVETCGGSVPFANVSSAPAQALVAELEAAGLLVEEGGGFKLTDAGLAAIQQASNTSEDAPEPDKAEPVDFRMLPLSVIAVTRNTRKVFDEAALAELAESIKAHGILQPLVVRRLDNGLLDPKGYELVAGERRYRAAELAGLTHVPAMVRTLTDREFLEVQLLENLQRVDVRPADEASAFSQLMAQNFTAEEIGLKVGKPAKFVLQRARLTSLIPFWLGLLEQDRLPLVAAHELARLPMHSQVVVKKYFEDYRSYELRANTRVDAGMVRQVIASEVTRLLDKAPWEKNDATLYPEAGACTTCPYRSSACKGLFDESEAKGDMCLHHACFTKKRQLYVERRKQEVKESGMLLVSTSYSTKLKGVIGYEHYNHAKASQEGAVQVLVVEGDTAGETMWVMLGKSAKAAAQDPEATAAAKAADALRIRKERVKKAERGFLAEKLTSDLVSETTGPVGHAVLTYLLLDELGTSRIPLVVEVLGCVEPTEAQQETGWNSRDADGNTPFRHWLLSQLAPRSFSELQHLFFTMKVRHRMDHEYEDRQFIIGSMLRGQGLGYEEVATQADEWVENRYYAKKKKGLAV